MSKVLYYLIIFSLAGCSLNSNSKFWTKSEKINKETQSIDNKIIQNISKSDEILSSEFNQDLKVKVDGNFVEENEKTVLTNNIGRSNFDGKLKNLSKFKFSKIDNFYQYEPEILFDKKSVIFFDNKGTIFKFNENSKLIWKKNFYNKSEQKLKPVLQFAKNGQYLIVADNIAKNYMLNIETGELIWSRNNLAPFNSQIKILNNKYFIVDYSNTLRCFSLENGNEIWNVSTQNSLIRSQKKLSMVIINNILYFNNSIGDISAVNVNNGELVWQYPTQNSLIYESSFSLENSELISDNKNLFFSNNKNKFFSINLNTGSLNWETKINSSLRSIIVGNLLFTISMEGYLFLIDKKNGNIIRVTDVFDNFKQKKRNLIKPTGFIIGKNNIYLTTNNGRLVVIDISSGKSISVLKIDGEKLLRPKIIDEKLFIVKDNSILKLN